MPGLDPISLGASGVQTLFGIGQSILGGIRARKTQKALEGLQTPTYGGSRSIGDYYRSAMNQYNTNPYQSQQYQYGQQQADRSLGAGINALQDRRSAIGGISRLTAIRNDAALRGGSLAEQQRNQNLGQYGQAAGMKGADEMRQFQYNQIAPYEKKYNLLAMKAGQANNTVNAGFQNIFGGLSSGSMLAEDQLLNGNGYGGYGDNYYNRRANAAMNNRY